MHLGCVSQRSPARWTLWRPQGAAAEYGGPRPVRFGITLPSRPDHVRAGALCTEGGKEDDGCSLEARSPDTQPGFQHAPWRRGSGNRTSCCKIAAALSLPACTPSLQAPGILRRRRHRLRAGRGGGLGTEDALHSLGRRRQEQGMGALRRRAGHGAWPAGSLPRGRPAPCLRRFPLGASALPAPGQQRVCPGLRRPRRRARR